MDWTYGTSTRKFTFFLSARIAPGVWAFKTCIPSILEERSIFFDVMIFDEMNFCTLHAIKSRDPLVLQTHVPWGDHWRNHKIKTGDLLLWNAGTASTIIKLVEIIKQESEMKDLIFFQPLPFLYLKIAVCSNQRASKLPQLLSLKWVMQKRQGLFFGKN